MSQMNECIGINIYIYILIFYAKMAGISVGKTIDHNFIPSGHINQIKANFY